MRRPVSVHLLNELKRLGGMPNAISRWDVDIVRVKRWYLLDAILAAVGRDDIDGFWDNPIAEREFHFRDLADTVDIEACLAITTG